MTTPKIEREDDGPDSYVCDNCASIWPFEKLEDMSDLGERLDAGGVVPAGECPVCGALCYPNDSSAGMSELDFDQIAEAQGWNDHTLVLLLREYIANQHADDALDDFARQKAAEENQQAARS